MLFTYQVFLPASIAVYHQPYDKYFISKYLTLLSNKKICFSFLRVLRYCSKLNFRHLPFFDKYIEFISQITDLKSIFSLFYLLCNSFIEMGEIKPAEFGIVAATFQMT